MDDLPPILAVQATRRPRLVELQRAIDERLVRLIDSASAALGRGTIHPHNVAGSTSITHDQCAAAPFSGLEKRAANLGRDPPILSPLGWAFQS